MGFELRLRADFSVCGYRDPRWHDDDLGRVKRVPGSALEKIRSGLRRGRRR